MTPAELAEYKRKSVEGGLPVGKAGPDHINAHWKAMNGELVNDGKGLYLTTDKDYGDFEFMVEYKALPDGDSGIYLRGIPQVQIWDTTKGDPRGRSGQGLRRALKQPQGIAGGIRQKMDRPFGVEQLRRKNDWGTRPRDLQRGEGGGPCRVGKLLRQPEGRLPRLRQGRCEVEGEGQAGREAPERLPARSGLCEGTDSTADPRERNPLAQRLHPRDRRRRGEPRTGGPRGECRLRRTDQRPGSEQLAGRRGQLRGEERLGRLPAGQGRRSADEGGV